MSLDRWLKPFLDCLGHKARRQMCPLYVSGLIGPGDRKSLGLTRRIAARQAPMLPISPSDERAGDRGSTGVHDRRRGCYLTALSGCPKVALSGRPEDVAQCPLLGE
jgi:hypothetical protein